jgi:hypothetical protein
MRARNRSRLIPMSWIAALSAAIPSCGPSDQGIALHPASGLVRFQGKPLPDVQLVFRPVAINPALPTPVPIGQTDPEGKFRLSTANGAEGRLAEGAPAGDYLVGISTPRRSDSANLLKIDGPKLKADPLNGRYSDPKTSGLKATIKPGSNTLGPFDLGGPGRTTPAAASTVGSDGRGR